MADISKWVNDLGSEDGPALYQATRGIKEAALKGTEAERRALAKKLATELAAQKPIAGKSGKEPKYSPAVRCRLARLLSLVATDQEVPPIVALLADIETRDDARWALERIPDPAATTALIAAAVDGTGPEYRIGAIHSLARRPGEETIISLKKLLHDPVLVIRLAAAESLADRADPTIDMEIAAAAKMDSIDAVGAVGQRAGRQFTKARVRAAQSLLRAGQKESAKKAFQAILASNPPPPQKKACESALAELG